MEKVIAASFIVESEAYRAITELRKTPFTDSYVVSQAVLIKKEDGALKVLDGYIPFLIFFNRLTPDLATRYNHLIV